MSLEERVKNSDKLITLKSGDKIVCSSEIWGQILGTSDIVLIKVETLTNPLKINIALKARVENIKVDCIVFGLKDRRDGSIWWSKEYPFPFITLSTIDDLTITIELNEI